MPSALPFPMIKFICDEFGHLPCNRCRVLSSLSYLLDYGVRYLYDHIYIWTYYVNPNDWLYYMDDLISSYDYYDGVFCCSYFSVTDDVCDYITYLYWVQSYIVSDE